MSGFVVVRGGEGSDLAGKMLARMAHRGPHRSGTATAGPTVLAQNCLRADTGPHGAEPDLPVVDPQTGAHLGYDGQIANLRALTDELGVPAGPCLEERVVLDLYRRHGAAFPGRLDDAIFALAIVDGERLLVARDVLGIKTLFYGRRGDALCFASELKALREATDDVHEFPAGHWMDESGELRRFASLPAAPPPPAAGTLEETIALVRTIIERAIVERVPVARTTAALLSGGLDSSVIATLAARLFRERLGPTQRLRTFAIGVGESEDVRSARLVAEHAGTDHHELIVDLDDVLAVLPEVIYHLESFDPSLVRSAASNYLVSRHAARRGVEVLLSGEGGDEVFCGYIYLKSRPLEELFARQIECLGYLHNNASLRLDRMNLAHSVRVVAPLISGELLRTALGMPPEYKQKPTDGGRIEKWIFRQAFARVLPAPIVERVKQEFSQGSGSAGVLPAWFESHVSDAELAEAKRCHPQVRSKEELHYFRLFVEHFGEQAASTVGQWPLL